LKYLRGCGQQQGFTLVERGVTWATLDYKRSPIAGGTAIDRMIQTLTAVARLASGNAAGAKINEKHRSTYITRDCNARIALKQET